MTVTFMFCAFIFLCAICFAKGGFFDTDWSTLGDRINQQVQEQVHNVNRNMRSQMAGINQDLDSEMNKLHSNMHQMQLDLATLQPLIEEKVQTSLQPLHAMMIKSNMAKGIGGITVATYGNRYTVLYKNGVKYSCVGDIFDDNKKSVYCTTKLSTNFTAREKICTANTYSHVGNIFCFGKDSRLQCVNDYCECTGQAYNLEGIKKFCGNNFGTDSYTKYIYFPDNNNVNHIPIPNPNPHVTCENNSFNCIWYGSGFVIDFTY